MSIVNQIPPSAIRGALALGTQFKDFRTSAPVLQQRLFAFGQGSTGVSLPSEKFLASSSGEVGELVGFGSPLHLMAKKLFPPDGSGAASVEATFYALAENDSGTAAVWTLDAVGAQTSAKDYQLRINDLFIPFSVPKDADNDAVLALIVLAINATISAPITVSSGAGSATSGRVICGAVTSALAAWQAVTDAEFSVPVDGTPQDVTPATFAGAADFAAIATLITTALAGAVCTYDTGTGKFTITSSTTGEISTMGALGPAAAPAGTDISGPGFMNGLTGVAEIVPGTDADNILTMTAKWKGATSNELDFEIVGTLAGLTYIFEQTATGAGDPATIQPAIDAMGSSIWYTMVCNQYATVAAFALLDTDNEANWQPLIHKPYVAAAGGSDRDAADTIAGARPTDRTNFYVLADGCKAFSFEIGARGVAEMVARANATPHRPYTGMQLTGLTPGPDTDQPSYTAGDTSEKEGVSTTLIVDNVIELEDMLLFYHPSAELPDPGYRYVVDVVKLQNITNSLNQKFGSDDWKGMTILADTDISTQPNVRRPKDAKGAVFSLADSWVDLAWCTDADFTKENLFLVKAAGVRNRFEGIIPVKLSDSLRQQDYLLKFGFNLA